MCTLGRCLSTRTCSQSTYPLGPETPSVSFTHSDGFAKTGSGNERRSSYRETRCRSSRGCGRTSAAQPEICGDWSVISDGDLQWIAKAKPWPEHGSTSWNAPSHTGFGTEAIEAETRLLLKDLGNLRPPICHVFVQKESTEAFHKPVFFAGINRLRVDHNARMRRCRYDGVTHRRLDGTRRVACCVRFNSAREPARDTPAWFCSVVREAAGECNVEVEFLTDQANRAQLQLSSDATFRNFAPTYLEQMIGLATDFDAAVGVTSGGLDLAAAAGLPVLRIGEFQAHGYQLGEGITYGKWGASFNWFLARDINVGLAHYSSTFANIPQATVRDSLKQFFRFLLKRDRASRRSQHLLLNPGVAFDESVLNDIVHLG